MNEPTTLSGEGQRQLRVQRLVRRINRACSRAFFLSWGMLILRFTLLGVKEPQTFDLMITAVLMLCIFWFMGRGLWLLINEMCDD